MDGYLNLFEEECDLIGSKVLRLLDGCPLTLLAPQETQGTLQYQNGCWTLQGKDFVVQTVQGLRVRLQLADNPYVESVRPAAQK